MAQLNLRVFVYFLLLIIVVAVDAKDLYKVSNLALWNSTLFSVSKYAKKLSYFSLVADSFGKQ
jgi:hypothetical protein